MKLFSFDFKMILKLQIKFTIMINLYFRNDCLHINKIKELTNRKNYC